MKIQYFEYPDTLYIEFRAKGIVETRDLDENTTLDVDADGNMLAITFEHASTRTDVRRLTDVWGSSEVCRSQGNVAENSKGGTGVVLTIEENLRRVLRSDASVNVWRRRRQLHRLVQVRR